MSDADAEEGDEHDEGDEPLAATPPAAPAQAPSAQAEDRQHFSLFSWLRRDTPPSEGGEERKPDPEK